MTDRKITTTKRMTKQTLRKNTEFIPLGTKNNIRTVEKPLPPTEFFRRPEIPKKPTSTSSLTGISASPREIMHILENTPYNEPINYILLCLNNVSEDLHYTYPLLYCAKLYPNLLNNENVLQLLYAMVKRDGENSRLLTVLAINLLLWTFSNVTEWPIFIMKLFLDDFVSEDRWCDYEECADMVQALIQSFEPIHRSFLPPNMEDCPNQIDRYAHMRKEIGELVVNVARRDTTSNTISLLGMTATYDCVKHYASTRMEQWINTAHLARSLVQACCSSKWSSTDELSKFIRNIVNISNIENSFKRLLIANNNLFVFITNCVIDIEEASFRSCAVHLVGSCIAVNEDVTNDCLVTFITELFSRKSRQRYANFVMNLLKLAEFRDSFGVFYAKLLANSTDLELLTLYDQTELDKYFNLIIDIACIGIFILTIHAYNKCVANVLHKTLEWIDSVMAHVCLNHSSMLLSLRRIMFYEEMSDIIPYEYMNDKFENVARRVRSVFVSQNSFSLLLSIGENHPRLLGSETLIEIVMDLLTSLPTHLHLDVDKLLKNLFNQTKTKILPLFALLQLYWDVWLISVVLTVFYSQNPIEMVRKYPNLSFLIQFTMSGFDKSLLPDDEAIANREQLEIIKSEEHFSSKTISPENSHFCRKFIYFDVNGQPRRPPPFVIEKLIRLNSKMGIDSAISKCHSLFVYLLDNAPLTNKSSMIDWATVNDDQIVHIISTNHLISHIKHKVSQDKFIQQDLVVVRKLTETCCQNPHNLVELLQGLSSPVMSTRQNSLTVLDLIFSATIGPKPAIFLEKIESSLNFDMNLLLDHLVKSLYCETNTAVICKYITFIAKHGHDRFDIVTHWLLSRSVIFDYPNHEMMKSIYRYFYDHLNAMTNSIEYNPDYERVVILLSCYCDQFIQFLPQSVTSMPEWLAVRVIKSPNNLTALYDCAIKSISPEGINRLVLSQLISKEKCRLLMDYSHKNPIPSPAVVDKIEQNPIIDLKCHVMQNYDELSQIIHDKNAVLEIFNDESKSDMILRNIYNCVNKLGFKFSDIIDQHDRASHPSLSTLLVDVVFAHINGPHWRNVVEELMMSCPNDSNIHNKMTKRLIIFKLDPQSFLTNGEIIDDPPESETLVCTCQIPPHEHTSDKLDTISQALSLPDLKCSYFPSLGIPRADCVLWNILEECINSKSLEPMTKNLPMLLHLVKLGGNIENLKLCLSQTSRQLNDVIIRKAYPAFPSNFPPVSEFCMEIKSADFFLRRLFSSLSLAQTGIRAKNRMQKASLICRKVIKMYPTLFIKYLPLLAAIIAGRGKFTFNELTSRHHFHLLAHILGLVENVMNMPFQYDAKAVSDIFSSIVDMIDVQMENKNPQGINGVKSIVIKLLHLVEKFICSHPEDSQWITEKILSSVRKYSKSVSNPARIFKDIKRVEYYKSAGKLGFSDWDTTENLHINLIGHRELYSNLEGLDDISKRKLDELGQYKSQLMWLLHDSTEDVERISDRLLFRELSVNPCQDVADEYVSWRMLCGDVIPEMMAICDSGEMVTQLCDLFIRRSIHVDLGDIINMTILKIM